MTLFRSMPPPNFLFVCTCISRKSSRYASVSSKITSAPSFLACLACCRNLLDHPLSRSFLQTAIPVSNSGYRATGLIHCQTRYNRSPVLPGWVQSIPAPAGSVHSGVMSEWVREYVFSINEKKSLGVCFFSSSLRKLLS